MRHSSFAFARPEYFLVLLFGLPLPDQFFGLVTKYSFSEGPHLLFVQVGPKLHQRHGTIETHIERRIEGIVVAFHEREHGRRFGIRSDGSSPKRTAVSQNVELIE